MSPRAAPSSVPLARSIDQALQDSEPLARLGQRLRESAARFAAIAPVLPAGLAPHVRPGPVDENGWALLAANPAVAAKLRQLLPAFEAVLVQKGWQATPIRVRLQSGL